MVTFVHESWQSYRSQARSHLETAVKMLRPNQGPARLRQVLDGDAKGGLGVPAARAGRVSAGRIPAPVLLAPANVPAASAARTRLRRKLLPHDAELPSPQVAEVLEVHAESPVPQRQQHSRRLAVHAPWLRRTAVPNLLLPDHLAHLERRQDNRVPTPVMGKRRSSQPEQVRALCRISSERVVLCRCVLCNGMREFTYETSPPRLSERSNGCTHRTRSCATL